MLRTMCLGLFLFGNLCSCTSVSYEVSSHFNGTIFINPWLQGPIDKSFSELLKWQWEGGKTEWPEWVPQAAPVLPTVVMPGEVHVTLINHASYLLQFSGHNILTDPVFSDRVSPFSFIGPARHRPPGIAFESLPKIDYVIISHNHYDHMDLPSIKQLAALHNPLFIVPLGNKPTLESAGVKRVVELDWWQNYEWQPNQRIHLVPVQHWSGRSIWDRNRTLWGGYVVDIDKLKVYFGGDTGYGPQFKETSKRLGPMDVSLLPIGAYEPRWFMKEQHMNPEDAVQAHIDLGSKQSFGMHYGTFQLTNEGIDRPVEDLQDSLKKAAIDPATFIGSRNGVTNSFTAK